MSCDTTPHLFLVTFGESDHLRLDVEWPVGLLSVGR